VVNGDGEVGADDARSLTGLGGAVGDGSPQAGGASA
jgi:hypothetical protein